MTAPRELAEAVARLEAAMEGQQRAKMTFFRAADLRLVLEALAEAQREVGERERALLLAAVRAQAEAAKLREALSLLVAQCEGIEVELPDEMARARAALAAPPSTAATPEHWVSASCGGEVCGCGAPATHKLGEEIMHDDPNPYRHNLTAYVCCACFRHVVGDAVWHTAATPEGK